MCVSHSFVLDIIMLNGRGLYSSDIQNEKMINVRPLCKALAIKVSKDLNEVPARVPEDIETLREWLLTQKHLRTPLGELFADFFF